ncbi:hypothetical protein [Ferdinandcohnia sp. Marseille-Q9671]
MDIVKFILFVAAISFFTIRVFVSKDDDEQEEIDSSVYYRFQKYLALSFMIFFSGMLIYKDEIFLWLMYYTGVMVLLLLSLKEGGRKLWWTGLLIIALIFSIHRVPKHPDSFQQWVSENKQLYCPSGYDCVKVSTYIDKDDNLMTKSEIVPIIYDYTSWYLFFARGEFSYEDSEGKEVLYKGINIAGWWIETSD